MAKLRIEFELFGGGRGKLGGQIDAPEQNLLGAVTLAVSGVATLPGSQPTVPSGAAGIYARIIALDGPCYVAVAASPDPTSGNPMFVLPGQPVAMRVTA